MFQSGQVSVAEIVAMHRELHSNYTGLDLEKATSTAYLAADDVSLGRTSKSQFLIFAIRFKGCRLVYPVRVVLKLARKRIPLGARESVPEFGDMYREILQELQAEGIRTLQHIGDWPIRAKMANVEGHSSETFLHSKSSL